MGKYSGIELAYKLLKWPKQIIKKAKTNSAQKNINFLLCSTEWFISQVFVRRCTRNSFLAIGFESTELALWVKKWQTSLQKTNFNVQFVSNFLKKR